jgi:hypothetical protein
MRTRTLSRCRVTSARAWRRYRCCCRSRRWRRASLCAISPATANSSAIVDYSAPHDHFTTSPDSCVRLSRGWCLGSAGGYPTICAGIVLSACVKFDLINSAPNDHVATGPDCCVKRTGAGSIRCARRHPTIGARIVSPAGVEVIRGQSAPDDHFATGPHSGMKRSGVRSIYSAGRCPTVPPWAVPPTAIQFAGVVLSSPDNHLAISPKCSVRVSARRCVGCRGCDPGIRVGVISCPGIEIGSRCRRRRRSSGWFPVSVACVYADETSYSAPHDHLAAGPNGCVKLSCKGSVGRAGRCPTVRDWVVLTAGVECEIRSASAPDHHFITCPDRCVTGSSIGRVSRAGSYPTVNTGNVSSACI